METKTAGVEAVAEATTPKHRVVEPQVDLSGMPFRWVFAFACLGFVALMAAFYFGHAFSAPKIVYQGAPPQQPLAQPDLRKLLEEAAKPSALESGKLKERMDSLSSEIGSVESSLAKAIESIREEMREDRLLHEQSLKGVTSSVSKGSGTMLDMTQTFDGEFKTMDSKFAEIAALLARIREKQADLDSLRKAVGDGNVAIGELSQGLATLSNGVVQLAQVVRTKLPSGEDVKAAQFGVDFPPPKK